MLISRCVRRGVVVSLVVVAMVTCFTVGNYLLCTLEVLV